MNVIDERVGITARTAMLVTAKVLCTLYCAAVSRAASPSFVDFIDPTPPSSSSPPSFSPILSRSPLYSIHKVAFPCFFAIFPPSSLFPSASFRREFSTSLLIHLPPLILPSFRRR